MLFVILTTIFLLLPPVNDWLYARKHPEIGDNGHKYAVAFILLFWFLPLLFRFVLRHN